MNTIIMWIMAAGAVIGGVDKIFGNRLGLGKRFEEGFLLLGTTALSMAGIIVGATFGCTITFTIPVGMGMISGVERPLFAKGMLIGLGMMPVSLLLGGLFCGLRVTEVLCLSLPVFVLSLMLMAGIRFFPDHTIRGFGYFAAGIGFLTTVGLVAGAVEYMTGFQILKGIAPIEEAMAVVSSIGVVLLGSLPVAELLRRILEKPLNWIGSRTGMNGNSVAGLLMGIVSPVPAIAMMKEMDARGKVVNAAFLVCGASALAAHMGFAYGTEPELVVPLLVSKLAGGLCGAGAAVVLSRKG